MTSEEKSYPVKKYLLTVYGLRALESGLTEEETSEFLQFAAEAPEAVRYLESDTHKYIAGKRDEIIFGTGYYEKYYQGGLRHFKHLRLHELRGLMDEKVFDPYPWMRYMEYVWFVNRYNDAELYLHGFVYSPTRKSEWGRQHGITIEGIGRDSPFTDKESEGIFRFLFGNADQFSLEPPYAWYD